MSVIWQVVMLLALWTKACKLEETPKPAETQEAVSGSGKTQKKRFSDSDRLKAKAHLETVYPGAVWGSDRVAPGAKCCQLFRDMKTDGLRRAVLSPCQCLHVGFGALVFTGGHTRR